MVLVGLHCILAGNVIIEKACLCRNIIENLGFLVTRSIGLVGARSCLNGRWRGWWRESTDREK